MGLGNMCVGAGRSVRRLGTAFAMGVVLAATVAGSGLAETRPALDYHATVRNGAITGSGFQIADGIVLTNAHVVSRQAPGGVVSLVVPQGGHTVTVLARVLAISGRMDLAVLRVQPGVLPVVSSRDAAPVQGTAVRAAGVVAGARAPEPRMELAGRISSREMVIQPFGPGFISALPGVRRGFSGGPVLDGENRLVGMIAALRPDPGNIYSATGIPLAGKEAFVLKASAIRDEVRRLLEEAGHVRYSVVHPSH